MKFNKVTKVYSAEFEYERGRINLQYESLIYEGLMPINRLIAEWGEQLCERLSLERGTTSLKSSSLCRLLIIQVAEE